MTRWIFTGLLVLAFMLFISPLTTNAANITTEKMAVQEESRNEKSSQEESRTVEKSSEEKSCADAQKVDKTKINGTDPAQTAIAVTNLKADLGTIAKTTATDNGNSMKITADTSPPYVAISASNSGISEYAPTASPPLDIVLLAA